MSKRLRLLTVFVLVSGGLLVIGIFAVKAQKSSTGAGAIQLYFPIVLRQPPARVSEMFEGSTPSGNVRVLGIVESLVEEPLFDVSVQVRGYDLDEQTFVSYTATTILTATLPGQGNMFDMTTQSQSLVDITAEVIAWDESSSITYAPVSVIDVDTFSIAEGQFITVTLRNDQPQALYDIVGVFWHETESYSFNHYVEFITDGLEPGEIYVYTTFAYISPWVEPNIIIQARVNP